MNLDQKQVQQLAKRSPKEALENSFQAHWTLLFPQLPPPVRQHRPIEGRKWAIDFAWVDEKLACELAGGSWTGGGHNRALGQAKDYEKHNALTRAGWRVFYFNTPMLKHMADVVTEVAEALCNAS